MNLSFAGAWTCKDAFSDRFGTAEDFSSLHHFNQGCLAVGVVSSHNLSAPPFHRSWLALRCLRISSRRRFKYTRYSSISLGSPGLL